MSLGHDVALHVARPAEGLASLGLPVHGPVDPGERSGIVAFEAAGDPDAWCRELGARGISLGVREGRLRVAPHVYTSEDDVERLLASLGELSRV